MSNGSGIAAGQAETAREVSFFERTEQNYHNIRTRCGEAADRIDRICDQMSGGLPREVVGSDAPQDAPPGAFDRVNLSEKAMYDAINVLEDRINRLENIGLL
jgi:hypothetical protein